MTTSLRSSRVLPRPRSLGGAALIVLLASGCPDEGGGGPGADDDDGEPGEPSEPECDDAITLPAGFCATVFADGVGRARHVTVSPSGDVFVAIADAPDGTSTGHVMALRDEDGDGVAERQETFGMPGGNGIAWHEGRLFFAQNDRILRYAMPDGTLVPEDAPEIVVTDLPAEGNHPAKTVVVTETGELFVNIGSATNACQEDDRVPGSPGVDPCTELETRAGIWRFDADAPGQTQDDGLRYATGVRNGNALALDASGTLWSAVNGRDQLYDNWPEIFSPEDELRAPSEEIIRVREGGDYGWPYCYHDPDLDQKVLAPEYGGDGMTADFCASVEAPEAVLPAHWSPLGMIFYRGDQFPADYRGGLFIANHGSRFEPQAETPLPGYNVAFVPTAAGEVTGPYERFAEGFAGDGRPLPEEAVHRPVGVAEAPDGSIYVTDDWGGRIWRIQYRGE